MQNLPSLVSTIRVASFFRSPQFFLALSVVIGGGGGVKPRCNGGLRFSF